MHYALCTAYFAVLSVLAMYGLHRSHLVITVLRNRRALRGLKEGVPALTQAEQMDLGELWRHAAQVPEEWYEYDVSGMNRLIETLYRRRLRIRDLITEFRKSNRNPFPNWAER